MREQRGGGNWALDHAGDSCHLTPSALIARTVIPVEQEWVIPAMTTLHSVSMDLPHGSHTNSERHAASNHGAPLAPSWRQVGEMPKTPAALGACPAPSELKSKHRETPVTDVVERTSYRAGRAISTNTIPSSALDACFSLGSPGCFLIFLACLIHHLQGQKPQMFKTTA